MPAPWHIPKRKERKEGNTYLQVKKKIRDGSPPFQSLRHLSIRLFFSPSRSTPCQHGCDAPIAALEFAAATSVCDADDAHVCIPSMQSYVLTIYPGGAVSRSASFATSPVVAPFLFWSTVARAHEHEPTPRGRGIGETTSHVEKVTSRAHVPPSQPHVQSLLFFFCLWDALRFFCFAVSCGTQRDRNACGDLCSALM